MSLSRIIRLCLSLLIALAACKGLYHLVSQAWYFFEGAYTGDATYYFTVGRGIYNGLSLYTDIFDTKPPGVYLLSAMSFWIFDSHLLGSLLNAFMVIAYPVLFGVVAYTFDKRRHTILLAVFFGILLSLYSAFQAGAWQVEWYGAFFGSLYAVALIFFQKKRSSSASIAIFTVCILLSIGFKEPFIFSLIGVGLLLLPKKKDLLSGLVMPLGIAAVAGVIGLLILGYAQGYFSLYLPSQFGHQAARAVPLWQRGMSIHVLMKYIWEFSYIFSVLITALFAHAVFQSRKFAYPGLRTAVVVLALYLGLTAGNLRGYPVGNHFVVMVPLYTALFLLVLQYVSSQKHTYVLQLLLGLMLLTLLEIPMSMGISYYAESLSNMHKNVQKHTEAAHKIDAIMDACAIDRYYYVEERPYMEFMRHSPLNFFVYTGPDTIIYYHPFIVEKQLNNFSESRLVIAQGDGYEIRERSQEIPLSKVVQEYLVDNFSTTAWECANGLTFPEEYALLFRKDPHTMIPFPFKMK